MIKFTDGQTYGQTDAKGYHIMQPFFKSAYKNENSREHIKMKTVELLYLNVYPFILIHC